MADIRIHNVNCMDFMAGVPDKAYDLAIVDPPYGIGEDGKRNHTRGSAPGSLKWTGTKNTTGAGVPSRKYHIGNYDTEPMSTEYFVELRRVSSNQIIFGANHFINRMPFDSPCWIVWDKVNGTTDFADCELAWTSFDTAVRKFSFMWNGMLQGNMKHKQDRIHPNEKPIELYKWILKNYAKPGDRILDTHGGSMSIAIACYDLGFELDLCELDGDYFQAGQKRLDAHISKYAPASEIPVNKKGELKLF